MATPSDPLPVSDPDDPARGPCATALSPLVASHQDRLATLGTLSAALAHELNNLLAPIAGYAQLALENPGDHALLVKSLTRTRDAARQGVRVCASVLSLARTSDRGAGERAATPVAAALDAAVEVLRWSDPRAEVTVQGLCSPGTVEVAVAPEALQQVLLNLLLNARRAMGGRGTVTVEAGPAASKGTVYIAVRDTGPGVSPQRAERLFSPFVTHAAGGPEATTPVHEAHGTGLGLWICRELVDAAGGSIRLEAADPQRPGACFTVLLPVAGAPAGSRQRAA